MHIVQIGLQAAVQRDVAGLLLIVDEEDHVDEGNAEIVQPAGDLAVVVLIGGVGGIEQLHGLIVHIQQLGELPGGQGVGEHVAVQRLGVGKAQGALHMLQLAQIPQQCLLPVIVPGGDQHGHQVGAAEGGIDGLLGDLLVILTEGVEGGFSIDIGAFVGEEKSGDDRQGKQRRDHIAGLDRHAAPGRDLGHKAAVVGLVDALGKEHQKPRHQGED